MEREVDVVAFDVERGKVREFARATLAEDPVHTDRAVATARGHADVVATPTYVAVSLHHRDQRGWVARLGLDIERMVVGTVRWTYQRPMVVGDAIVGRRRVVADERRSGSGGELRLVSLATDFVDAIGETVVTQEDVLVERPAR
ncbi:MaoC family dehydratase N-terminal domain-containing protein [Pseudonocardia sp. NPDC049154]|uniref:FAS1-like dehydratase domain-containing protein n=1 Tax=Pseudonocardia sp. NPDC049154 TaxID=3155501 RepID=UPI003411F0C5